MRRFFLNKNVWIAAVLMVVVGSSCKKYADPPPFFEDYGNDSTAGLQRKVLVISIDGATGSEVKTVAPPNILALQKTGKYTYNEMRDNFVTDASSWVTMMTGVGYAKHEISDSSFLVTTGDISSGENNPIPYYPNVLNYILPIKTDYKIAVISPWLNLNNYLKAADYDYNVPNDEIVKDSAVSILSESNPLGVMVVNFNSVELAGNAGAFSASDAGYKAAILKTDEYVGNIVQAIRARKNYSRENWLIMITTNHGGSATNPKPGFIVASNPIFKEVEIKQNGLNSVHFNGSGGGAITASVPNDNGLYNSGADKDFTVQLQIKINTAKHWPGFFAKSAGISGNTTTGWTFMQVDNKYAIVFGGSANGGNGKLQTNAKTVVVDGKWHTITLTVKMGNGKRTATLYTDGAFDVSADITSRGNLDNTAPLRLGYTAIDGSGASDFYAADVEYFNVALDAQTIADNIGLMDISKHPNYANLIGYWPIEEGAGSILFNGAPTGYNMQLNGAFKWDALGKDVPITMVPDSTDAPSVIATTADVSANILYWLKIGISQGWSFDGQPWLNNFDREIYGQ